MSGTLWIGFCVFLGVLILELLAPNRLAEGFQALTPTPKAPPANLLSNLVSQRGDVGPGREQNGVVQDGRYFMGYADVQRYGFKKDFCRMVTLSGEEGTFFSCALAGTKGTSPYAYRTKNVSQGFLLSRDDYMRDILADGREAYCRILRYRDGTFQPLCRRALDTGFNDRDEIDPNPPEDIITMLDFYSGCQMWLRFRDDLLDTIGRAKLQFAGKLGIDQRPNPTITRGLTFNGRDQFVRLGDADDLTLGNKIKMRTVRAFSVWVNFDAFTNNAHIFDFGDGAGKNNLFLGILGKGDGADEPLRPASKCAESTVPESPAGAQWCPEMRPQELLAQSAGNVNDYSCTTPEMYARRLPPSKVPGPREPTSGGSRATLQYEVWDQKLRKVQIKINRAIPLQKWTHIVITAATADAMRPDLQVWVNGNLLYVHEQGYLPQAKTTTHNYLGKSNWMNDASEYELRDELFQGSIFDFRMYSAALSEAKIKRILQWGMGRLGLDNSYAVATSGGGASGSLA